MRVHCIRGRVPDLCERECHLGYNWVVVTVASEIFDCNGDPRGAGHWAHPGTSCGMMFSSRES